MDADMNPSIISTTLNYTISVRAAAKGLHSRTEHAHTGINVLLKDIK